MPGETCKLLIGIIITFIPLFTIVLFPKTILLCPKFELLWIHSRLFDKLDSVIICHCVLQAKCPGVPKSNLCG